MKELVDWFIENIYVRVTIYMTYLPWSAVKYVYSTNEYYCTARVHNAYDLHIELTNHARFNASKRTGRCICSAVCRTKRYKLISKKIWIATGRGQPVLNIIILCVRARGETRVFEQQPPVWISYNIILFIFVLTCYACTLYKTSELLRVRSRLTMLEVAGWKEDAKDDLVPLCVQGVIGLFD